MPYKKGSKEALEWGQKMKNLKKGKGVLRGSKLSIDDLKKLPYVNRRQLAILNGTPNAVIPGDMKMFKNPYFVGYA